MAFYYFFRTNYYALIFLHTLKLQTWEWGIIFAKRKCVCERERNGYKDTHRKTQRQRERERDRKTGRGKGKDRDRKTKRQRKGGVEGKEQRHRN